MILYNVTVSVDESVHTEWLEWMKEKHIPDVIATGLFSEYKFFKILSDDPEEKTYSIQYFLNSMDDYDTYQKKYAPALQAEHAGKFGDKFVAFRTLLESV
ncbi:MAG: DUF4286 family protein [Ignavibacteria bacterium]|nr:DUF4286 family protein [Ignavibacteria bacterium]